MRSRVTKLIDMYTLQLVYIYQIYCGIRIQLLFVEYQFSWISWVQVNQEFKYSNEWQIFYGYIGFKAVNYNKITKLIFKIGIRKNNWIHNSCPHITRKLKYFISCFKVVAEPLKLKRYNKIRCGTLCWREKT